MKSSVNKMLQDRFHSEMGPDKIPPVIKYYVDMNANKGFDGAKAITAAVETELSTNYLADGLDTFFGSTSHLVVVQNSKSSGSGNWQSAWYATGWLEEYNGYDVIYAFQTAQSYSYKDSDCRSGDVKAMSACINGMHGASNWGQQAGRRRYHIFMSGTGQGYYWKQYSDSDLRMIDPGTAASKEVGTISINVAANSD